MNAQEYTAVHEAAHAVIAHTLGMRVDAASIEPETSALGIEEGHVTVGEIQSTRITAQVILAGPVAELLLKIGGEEIDPTPRVTDWERAKDEISKLPGVSYSEVLEETRRLVMSKADSIVAVARLLLHYGTLKGPLLCAAINCISKGMSIERTVSAVMGLPENEW